MLLANDLFEHHDTQGAGGIEKQTFERIARQIGIVGTAPYKGEVPVEVLDDERFDRPALYTILGHQLGDLDVDEFAKVVKELHNI